MLLRLKGRTNKELEKPTAFVTAFDDGAVFTL
jgi:hypothetical protein